MIPSCSPLVKFWQSSLFVTRTVKHVRSHAFAHAAFGLFHFRWKYRCENGWSTTPRFISFPLRAFWSMIFWRKRPERKNEVHEFPVWNVHEAHGRSTAVGRNAPSRTQTIILQVIYWPYSGIRQKCDFFWTTFLLLPIGFGSLKHFGSKV